MEGIVAVVGRAGGIGAEQDGLAAQAPPFVHADGVHGSGEELGDMEGVGADFRLREALAGDLGGAGAHVGAEEADVLPLVKGKCPEVGQELAVGGSVKDVDDGSVVGSGDDAVVFFRVVAPPLRVVGAGAAEELVNAECFRKRLRVGHLEMVDDVLDDRGARVGVPCDVGDGMGCRREPHVDVKEQGISDGDVLYEPGGLQVECFSAFPTEEAGLVEGDEGAAESDGQVPDGLDGAGILLDAVVPAAACAEVPADAGLLP